MFPGHVRVQGFEPWAWVPRASARSVCACPFSCPGYVCIYVRRVSWSPCAWALWLSRLADFLGFDSWAWSLYEHKVSVLLVTMDT